MSARREDLLRTIEVYVGAGAKWAPVDPRQFSYLRRSLAKASLSDARQVLERLARAGAFERPVFHELVPTPKMHEILSSGFQPSRFLLEFAGVAPIQPARGRGVKHRTAVSAGRA